MFWYLLISIVFTAPIIFVFLIALIGRFFIEHMDYLISDDLYE